ncbi:hypothetical protein EJ06DRAFT_525451 [Trichodelitschia bisporula]|uniref:Lytic polysaccharide monooxygenase n=1 Tax=Trichodelitschia bisporula TaxID=703511 RepID=A0A6G1I9U5_9PEZI|nr:hypothetical protein EJ06DRAFT_525451 [Trichodelitschia bisporula]
MASSWLVQLLLAAHAAAHMQLQIPLPIRSPLSPNKGPNTDYDYLDPLDKTGSNFPCKGYQTDAAPPTATYSAGDTYNFTLAGSAMHGGGSCQLSLSYDGGKSFHVIKSLIGGCPSSHVYPFTVPSYTPSGNALFAWTWLNNIGNREFYMDCASVQVSGGQPDAARFNALPGIWVANLESVNTCTTTANVDPVFPDPGPEVVYGGGLGPESPKSPAYCEVDGRGAKAASAGAEAPASTAKMVKPKPAVFPEFLTTMGERPTAMFPEFLTTMGEGPTAPAAVSTSAASSVAAASSMPMPPMEGMDHGGMSGMDHGGMSGMHHSDMHGMHHSDMAGMETGSEQSVSYTTVDTTTTCTLTIGSASGTGAASSTFSTVVVSSAASPPPSSVASPLPTGACNPGSFLCTSPAEFLTCDQDPPGQGAPWDWKYPRQVAEGMMCLPHVVTRADGSTYRDDQYVRATT